MAGGRDGSAPNSFPPTLLQTLKWGQSARHGRVVATGATVVTGTQWGDEGKGKVVDYLAETSDIVVRYNGGANAGHTVIVRKGKMNVIAAGVALDPEVLAEEIKAARAVVGKLNLIVSERAHVVLPLHKLLDELEEEKRGASRKIGTTKRGIGPAYKDKAGRSGMRVAELVDPDALSAHVRRAAAEVAPFVPAARKAQFSAEAMLKPLQQAADAIRPYVGDAEGALWSAHASGKAILLEGAHGMMLDLDFGTYPFVTSSSCGAGGSALSGLPPTAVNRSVGVVKAYTTRVGEGPFPTELTDEQGGRKLRELGGEYGTTTGRPRRCGWLDLVIVRRAVRLSGLTDLAVTKLDVLQGIDPLRVCVGYSLDGKSIAEVPARADHYERCRPRLRRMKPIPKTDWAALAKSRQGFAALPKEARDYLKLIETHAGAPVTFVGVGPGRADVLLPKTRAGRAKRRP